MLECLTNIVGLTREQCNCFDGDLPADYAMVNASDSNYYITDDGDGFPLVEAVYQSASCGDGNIYDVLQKCRTQAIEELETNLGAALTMGYDSPMGFHGSIGRTVTQTGLGLLQQYVGIQLRPRRIRNASMTISAISAGFISTTGTITVTVRCSAGDDLFPPETRTLNITAGRFQRVAFDTPINLPFHYESYSEPVTYYVYYDSTGHVPFANDFTCCSYNPEYLNVLSAGGLNVSDIEDTLQDWDYLASAGRAYGLSIEGYSQCDQLEWLCTVERVNGKNYRQTLAKAVQFRATAYLAKYVLDSPNLNLFTLAKAESIQGKYNHSISEFNNRITWLSQNVPPGASDCLGCRKRVTTMRKGSL